MGPKHKYKANNTTVDLPVCTSINNIQEATARDSDLQEFKAYIMQGWPYKKEGVAQDIQRYWPIRHDLAMVDGVTIKASK